MSLPLKPISIDISSKKLSSRQKKFNNSVSKALEHFDYVVEWADYIASLGKLLKSLQSITPSDSSVGFNIPQPYQVSRRLCSSLSSDLPAGVHQKTLEVYTYIFEKIGPETLAAEVNIWMRGILPLMAYASTSVKIPLIELYEKYILTLPSQTLKIMIKPLVSSLFPGIDDDSSEFQPRVFKLLETLEKNVNDDALFWQTIYLVIITDKDRRLGALVWFTKKFPSLDIKINEVELFKTKDDQYELNFNSKRKLVMNKLPTNIKNLVYPESALLTRALVTLLKADNDSLVKRGTLDLLLQSIPLNSAILSYIITEEEKELLLLSCCEITLNKDMSLNRRVLNWMLGPVTTSSLNSETKHNDLTEGIESTSIVENNRSDYFMRYGFRSLINGLLKLMSTEEKLLIALNILIILMERWEISSPIIPEIFVPLFLSIEKFSGNSKILSQANNFFDMVETNIIWGKIYEYLHKTKNMHFLNFVITNFNVSQDEEIIVRHLPLILLSIISFEDTVSFETKDINGKSIFQILLSIIPERAFLPLASFSSNKVESYTNVQIVDFISEYYSAVSNPMDNNNNESYSTIEQPFHASDLTFLLLSGCQEALLKSIDCNKYISVTSEIFVDLFEKIPNTSGADSNDLILSFNKNIIQRIILVTQKEDITCETLHGIATLFTRYLWNSVSLVEALRVLKVIIEAMWAHLLLPSNQGDVIKDILLFERNIKSDYLQAVLACVFLKEQDITNKIRMLDLLWNSVEKNSTMLERILEILLDELLDEQNPHYLYVSRWTQSTLKNESFDRLLNYLLCNFVDFKFFETKKILSIDDLDMYTYKVQIITAVLRSNKQSLVKYISKSKISDPSLNRMMKDKSYTYKNFLLLKLIEFLKYKNNNHASSIRSSLILLDLILDGSEYNFKDIFTELMDLSRKYVKQKGIEAETISVSLLNIISKILKLSQANGMTLETFEENNSHGSYMDFLISLMNDIEGPIIIPSYIKLVLESMTYIDHNIFNFLLPLTNTFIGSCKTKVKEERVTGGLYESISIILYGLEELIELSHGYLLVDEKEGLFSQTSNKGDFLQTIVTNVFSGDASEYESKLQSERLVVLQSIQQIVFFSVDVWYWAHEIISKNEKMFHKNSTSFKFKFRVRNLLEKLFLLEPLEVLEDILSKYDTNYTMSIVHTLDGNRPNITLPHLFNSIIIRKNPNNSVKFNNVTSASKNSGSRHIYKIDLSMKDRVTCYNLISFLIEYIKTMENAAMEEIYGDFMLFLKEICSNSSSYVGVSINLLLFVAMCGEKIAKTKFGEQKNIRKEFSDFFVKYLSICMANLQKNGLNNLTADIEIIQEVVRRLKYCINDDTGSEKYNANLSIIISSCIVPSIKSMNEYEIPSEILSLAQNISSQHPSAKVWKNTISEVFMNEKRFSKVLTNKNWIEIIFNWSQYPEYKSKLLPELIALIDAKNMTITPTIINFGSSNASELKTKKMHFLRIAYLVMVAPMDNYLVNFKELLNLVINHIQSKSDEINAISWILLRVMLIKFGSSHFTNSWNDVIFALQSQLQDFYEKLQIQEKIDSCLIFQECKTLDLLLTLNIEDFSSTNNWLFIIDTINCFNKTENFISLVDELSEASDYGIPKQDDISLFNEANNRQPFLSGIHKINSYTQLRNFFFSLSYLHYETVFNLKDCNIELIENDLYADIKNTL